jgi:hypothetical protein
LLKVKPEGFPLGFQNMSATAVRMIRKAKLNAENCNMYLPVFSGLCEEYSRKVIRLAKDEIKVPTPPMLTPTSRSA